MPDPPAKPLTHREDALAVLTRLRDAGHVAYFAGGCVRDLLLKREPKDFDIATDAPPDRVRSLFSNTQAVGAAFGVILVRQGKSVIEVATFRTDGDYVDGRRPESVRFTTAEEDAQRRDFTINGLFLDPVANQVIDYVGGQADLAAKVIRAIGQPRRRFHEDHLRLLRAVRFAAGLGFTIEPATADAIRGEAPSLKRISPERIADELRRMLTPPTRIAAWRMLIDLKLLGEVFRLLPVMVGGIVDAERALSDHAATEVADPHADAESATSVAASGRRGIAKRLLESVAPGEPISFPLALAAAVLSVQSGGQDLPAGLTKPAIANATRSARTLFKISNDEYESMKTILSDAGGLLEARWTLARRMRFMARPTAADTRKLIAGIAGAGFHQVNLGAIEDSLRPLEGVDCAPTPLVSGDDLVAAGLSPGPVFKKVLDAVYDAQLEARVTDQSAALRMALQLAKRI